MFKLILIAWFHEVLDKFLDILLCNCNKQLEIWNVLEEGEGGGEGNLFWRSSLMQITKLGKSVVIIHFIIVVIFEIGHELER